MIQELQTQTPGPDPDDRKRFEDALRESEARYRTLAESSAVGIWHIRADGSTAYANPALCHLLELEGPQQLDRLDYTQFFTPRGLQAITEQPPGSRVNHEVEMLTSRGNRRIVVTSRVPLTDPNGQINGFIGTFTDITQRKRAEEALRNSERRLKTLIQAMPDILFVMTRDGHYIEVHAANPSDLVASADQIEKKNIRDTPIPPELLDAHFHAVERAFATGQPQDFEYSLETLSGPNYYEQRLVTLNDNEILILVRNITQRRRAEQAQRDSEDRWRFLVQNAPDYILTLDLQGRILYINRTAPGYRVEELTGTLLLDWVPSQFHTTIRAAFQHVIATGEHTSYENDGIGPNGQKACYINRIGPLWHGDRVTGMIIVSTDITEKQRAEEERRTLEAQVQHAQKLESLGVLAGGIAHDFNNLLMGILGNAGLALLEMPASAPGRGSVEKIESVALHAAELTNQMLAYSGKGHFVLQAVDISRLIRDMHHLLEMVVSKKARLVFDLTEALPPVEADPTQLRQVLMNLISNASEAIGDQPGTITVHTGKIEASRADLVEVYLDADLPEGPYVMLSVTDTGCGMVPETRAKIFDPFFTTKFTGRGLGLAAVLGIVRGHKGAIQVTSQPGLGTRFTLLLPPGQSATEDPLRKLKALREAPGPGGTILVVDDEEVIRIVVKATLEKFGYAALLAADGLEAVEMFRLHGPTISAVLLDMTMPRMSGEEVFSELRALRPDVRVILSSGYTEQEATLHFRDRSHSAFIQKPYQPLDLLNKLQEILQT